MYDVNIRGGIASLVPSNPAAVAAINTIPAPLSTPVPTFNLTEEQMKIGSCSYRAFGAWRVELVLTVLLVG